MADRHVAAHPLQTAADRARFALRRRRRARTCRHLLFAAGADRDTPATRGQRLAYALHPVCLAVLAIRALSSRTPTTARSVGPPRGTRLRSTPPDTPVPLRAARRRRAALAYRSSARIVERCSDDRRSPRRWSSSPAAPGRGREGCPLTLGVGEIQRLACLPILCFQECPTHDRAFQALRQA